MMMMEIELHLLRGASILAESWPLLHPKALKVHQKCFQINRNKEGIFTLIDFDLRLSIIFDVVSQKD